MQGSSHPENFTPTGRESSQQVVGSTSKILYHLISFNPVTGIVFNVCRQQCVTFAPGNIILFLNTLIYFFLGGMTVMT